MRYALQRCCTTPVFLNQYETSTDAVLTKLGIVLVDIKEFNCCGYPLKNTSFKAHILSSSRNLALAGREELAILTFCNCCYGTLKHVNHLMRDDASLRKEINETLSKEGLKYDGKIEVKHLLEILYKDLGLADIREKVVRTFQDLKIATHYGCHILRPRQIVQFDNPLAPTIFDELVEITGATSVPWSKKLECCGSPMLGIDDELSMDLTQTKIEDARKSGVHYLCVACPYCQLQFDRVQRMLLTRRHSNHQLPSLLFTQLLGLSLGIDSETLGIDQNELDAKGVTKFLS